VRAAAGPLRGEWSIRLTPLPARFDRAGAGWRQNGANQRHSCRFLWFTAISRREIVLKIRIVRPILAIFIAQYLP
jgi:hypothetical protein